MRINLDKDKSLGLVKMWLRKDEEEEGWGWIKMGISKNEDESG